MFTISTGGGSCPSTVCEWDESEDVGSLSRDRQDWTVVKFPADSVAVVKERVVFGPVVNVVFATAVVV